ncbi:MAG: 50S ribosomal protein L33 [Myxococcota bacterium]
MRDVVKLTCPDCGRDNYVTTWDKKSAKKISKKKYCSHAKCRGHRLHKQGRISKG